MRGSLCDFHHGPASSRVQMTSSLRGASTPGCQQSRERYRSYLLGESSCLCDVVLRANLLSLTGHSDDLNIPPSPACRIVQRLRDVSSVSRSGSVRLAVLAAWRFRASPRSARHVFASTLTPALPPRLDVPHAALPGVLAWSSQQCTGQLGARYEPY